MVTLEDTRERRPELALPLLEEDPHALEVGLVLDDVDRVRHRATTPSSMSASRSCATTSRGSPWKTFRARAGRWTVSTFATIVGEFFRPTLFGSIPTSAQDQWTITPPRLPRIFPRRAGPPGFVHPKFTVRRDRKRTRLNS